MKKLHFTVCVALFLFFIQGCRTDSGNKPGNNVLNGNNGYSESFRKTGWINDNRFRAVVYIITEDECRKSTETEIEERIRFEAIKNLQRDLSPDFNRNASIQIKNLAEKNGKIVKADKGCVEKNIFFYDIEKDGLRSDFEKIKKSK